MYPRDEGFEVWPQNWAAIEAFLAVQTQWAHGFNGPTGLDYGRVRQGLQLAGIRPTRELFHQLRTIEGSVLDTLASQQKRQESRAKK